MPQTLKERYKAGRIAKVGSRMKLIDIELLNEARTVTRLCEAMDEGDLTKVAAIVQKLDAVKTPQLPKLKAAIEQAQAELNKYTAGGPIAAAWSKMKQLAGIDNPVVKVTTFANALERGFSQIPLILKNNGIDLKNVDLNKSLAGVLGQAGAGDNSYSVSKHAPDKEINGTDALDIPGPAEGDGIESPRLDEADGRLSSIVSQLQKALSPGGIFSGFKKVPYISSADLADELVRAPIKVFASVARKIQQGAKTSDIADDMKDQLRSHGDVETRGTSSEEPAQPSRSSQPSAPAKGTTAASASTPAGQRPPSPRGGGANVHYEKAKARLGPLIRSLGSSPAGIDSLVKQLVDAGLDVDKLSG